MGIRIRVNFPRAVLRTIEVMAWDWAICRNLRRAVLDYRKA
jgi:hypothetical protein